MNRKFGLLVYKNTYNLGDEIQSLAARQFLPSVDYHLDRDVFPQEGEFEESVKVILNGWFLHLRQGTHWPPPSQINPLLTSLHITPEAQGLLLSDAGVAYLKRHEPIGCRDLYTLGLMRRRGIKSFFSACLTVALTRPNVERDPNLIVANDLSESMLVRIGSDTDKELVFTSHIGYPNDDIEQRFKKAESLLDTYARASCVVTTRLHCALPCLAMNTPVLLINPRRPGNFLHLWPGANSSTLMP